ncbi:LrgA [Shewanella piezotolerans WP3]|uniref:LrgA n=1 Tax=Shewanella piezotolerans (strain WP3 / JCM 13877) TaxID=225849 RepID=B8CK05_SHEPW|nr:CidA/LrgA family protein [Shewanella piezotolerans]ACJ27708.1 LrgA [Shewanella piezotolerans WP3]
MPLSFSAIQSKLCKLFLLLAQVSFFCLFAYSCQQLASWLHSPLPGSVIGLAILLLLLCGKVIPEKAVNSGAAWLIGDLLLFFIPPVVAVLKYEDILEQYGVTLISSMLAASCLVLLGTAFTVDRLFNFERKLKLQKQRKHAQLLRAPVKIAPTHTASGVSL